MTTRARVPVFIFLCALSIAFWWRPLIATFRLALANDAYTHILLILPLSAALLYMGTRECRIELRPAPAAGAPLLLLALAIGLVARWRTLGVTGDVQLTLDMLALVIWWIASVLLCFGTRTFQAFLFPLCFLFLLVPIPDFALTRIVEFLQQQSALAARFMFRLAGVPVTQDGFMLSIPDLDIEVAQECSSIRSSLMLVVTTMVLAHLFLRSGWKKALLIAAAVPLSFAKNGLRIFVIAELGTRVDPGFLSGRFHHHGGIVFFGIALLAVGALLWLIRRTELPAAKARSAAA